MGYLDMVRAVHPPASATAKPLQQYEINEINEISPDTDLEPLYARLRTIYTLPDFDSPEMLAERSAINQTIYRAKYRKEDGR